MQPRLLIGREPPTDALSKWRFPQGDVVLRGNTKDELIRVIFEYRLRNNIDVGDPNADIDSYYCRQYPKFCVQSDGMPSQNAEPMLNRVSRWAAAMARQMPRGGYAFEAQAEADRRAQICMNCPKNVAWRGACGGCSGSTLQLLQQVKSLKKTRRDGNLNACTVTGWENGASVWLPLAVLRVSDDQRADLPEACWLRTA